MEALVSSREVQRELIIAVCVIWRRWSAWSLSELLSDSQDIAEVDRLIHLTVDSLQRTSLKGSHAAFRVGCAFLCPVAGYGRTKYMTTLVYTLGLDSSVNQADRFVHLDVCYPLSRIVSLSPQQAVPAEDWQTATSIYNFSAVDIDGNVVSLEKYR